MPDLQQDPADLRETAAGLRKNARYADGQQYRIDLERATQLENEALRLERIQGEAARQKHAARTKDLKRIHIAKRDLALSDEEYRAIIDRLTGKNSAADLGALQRGLLLAEFKRLGWKPARAYRKREVGEAATQVDKIRALWIELANAGAVRDRSERGLGRYCARVVGKQRPEWLQPADANRIIEGLKAWLARTPAAEADK